MFAQKCEKEIRTKDKDKDRRLIQTSVLKSLRTGAAGIAIPVKKHAAFSSTPSKNTSKELILAILRA